MMKLNIGVLLLPTLILLSSCDKEWLNERPNKNLAIPTTFKDFQALLDNNGTMNGNQVGLGEVGSDDYYCRPDFVQYLTDNELNAYTWSNSRPYTNVTDWRSPSTSNVLGAYGTIYYCNVVLDGLENLKPHGVNEQIAWNNIRGQALFQRARCFFELAQVFAPPHHYNSSGSELGIPLRLSSDVNLPSTRSTVRETYNKIISDLELALQLLPRKAAYVTRGSQWATQAMLARTFLAIEDYEGAKRHAIAALSIDNSLIDYNDLNPAETYPMPRLGKEEMFTNRLVNYTPTSNAFIYPDLYGSYDTQDLRRKIFFRDNGNGTISFRGSYYKSNILFGGLATDEMYLIRAECRARTGETALAMQDLNDLLRTRWEKVSGVSTYIDQSASNAEEALVKILKERRKELLLRGIRWSDLRRLNRDPRFAITISRVIDGVNHVLEPNSFRYTLPIPKDIVQWTGMQQNPGW